MTWSAPMPLTISQPRSERFDEIAEVAWTRREPVIETKRVVRYATEPDRRHFRRVHGQRVECRSGSARLQQLLRLVLGANRPMTAREVAGLAGISAVRTRHLLLYLVASGRLAKSHRPGSGEPATWGRP